LLTVGSPRAAAPRQNFRCKLISRMAGPVVVFLPRTSGNAREWAPRHAAVLERPPCVRRPSTRPVQYRIPRGSALVLSRESCGQSVLDWQNLAWSAWRSRPGHFSSCAPLVAARQCITVTANTTMMAAVSEPMTARGTNSLRCFMLTPAPGVSHKTFGRHLVRQLAEKPRCDIEGGLGGYPGPDKQRPGSRAAMNQGEPHLNAGAIFGEHGPIY
jgi:hypothetical protein